MFYAPCRAAQQPGQLGSLTMGQDRVSVRFREPPEDLRPFFTTFYRAEFDVGDEILRDALQPEWGGMRFFNGARPVSRIAGGPILRSADFSAMGPTTKPIDFEVGSTRFWGIGLLPLGWGTFLNVPAHTMANCIFDGRAEPAFAPYVALADKLTADPARENEEFEFLVSFFRNAASRHPVDRERVLAIHEMLLDPDLVDVASMATSAGLSQRTLERTCRNVFGFPPKLLLRRQRFMRSLAAYMSDPSMGWINAMDSNYFDQSQFVRDCRAFLGMSPSEYATMDHPVLAAFMRERARVHGSAVQTLDKPG